MLLALLSQSGVTLTFFHYEIFDKILLPVESAFQTLPHIIKRNLSDRVAKCHGYGGYIRVKKLEGWGKISGGKHSFTKSSIVLVNLSN